MPRATSARRVTKGATTREAILRTGLQLAMRVGLTGLSLGDLAEALGLSKSGLFAHFRSKEVLQLAVLEEAVRRFTEGVVAPALAQPRGEPRLRALFENKLRWLKANGAGEGCFFQALVWEFDDRPGPVREALVQARRDWRGVLARAARLAVEVGQFRADLDAEQLAFELVGIDATYTESVKLLGDARAATRARAALERLLAAARRPD